MGVPILRQGRMLIASVPASGDDQDLRQLQRDLASAVSATGAAGVVVDVSGLDVLDSYATRMLETVSQVVRLRGAETVIVGIRPEVAMAMVELGVTLQTVSTGLDLEDGIGMLARGDTAGGGDLG